MHLSIGVGMGGSSNLDKACNRHIVSGELVAHAKHKYTQMRMFIFVLAIYYNDTLPENSLYCGIQ